MTPRERAIEALFGEFLDGDDIACGERDGYAISVPALERAIRSAERAARAQERERCAGVAEAYPDKPPFGDDYCAAGSIASGQMTARREIAAAIRALPEETGNG